MHFKREDVDGDLDSSDYEPQLEISKMFNENWVLDNEKVFLKIKKDGEKEWVKLKDKIWRPDLSYQELKSVLHCWLQYTSGDHREVVVDSPVDVSESDSIDLIVIRRNRISCFVQIQTDYEDKNLEELAYYILFNNSSSRKIGIISTDGKTFKTGLAYFDENNQPIFDFPLSFHHCLKDDHRMFWKAITGEDSKPERLYSLELRTGASIKVRLDRVLGRGSGGMVFLARNFNDRNQAYALKFSKYGQLLEEQKNNDLIQERCPNGKVVLPIVGEAYHKWNSFALAYPVAKPEYLEECTEREEIDRHFRQLWSKLNMLHSAGLLHRAIRIDNVVVYEGEAYFIDVERASLIGTRDGYWGGLWNASQRVLKFLHEGRGRFEFTKNDDIESFYKMWHCLESKVEHPESDVEKTKGEWAQTLIEFWEKFDLPFGCDSDDQEYTESIVNFVEKSLYRDEAYEPVYTAHLEVLPAPGNEKREENCTMYL